MLSSSCPSSINGASAIPYHLRVHVWSSSSLACSHSLLSPIQLTSLSTTASVPGCHSTVSVPNSIVIRAADPHRPQPFHEPQEFPKFSTEEIEPRSTLPKASNSKRRTLFLLDVAPLCYTGKKPQPSAFIGWMRLFFQNVTARQPIVAVMDGERGNEYRRHLLMTYKANRNTFVPLVSSTKRQTWKGDDADLREAFPFIKAFLDECHVPVACVDNAEADDVVASLADQAVEKGMQVIIASPDKDFKQLLCADVQIVAPLSDLKRWSFNTYKQYFAQYKCDPGIELGLRCMLGDKADNIPGLGDLAPGFGRNTALKLMKKHGSLESLLNAAEIRTVGKPYIQKALTEHAPFLLKNIELLRLRRDIPVPLEEEWCVARETSNDLEAFSKLENKLKELKLQRAKKDGARTGSFSDQLVISKSKYQAKSIKPISSQNLS